MCRLESVHKPICLSVWGDYLCVRAELIVLYECFCTNHNTINSQRAVYLRNYPHSICSLCPACNSVALRSPNKEIKHIFGFN